MPVILKETGLITSRTKHEDVLPQGFNYSQFRQGLQMVPILISALNVLSESKLHLGRFENGQWVEKDYSGEEINQAKIRVPSRKLLQRKRTVLFRSKEEQLGKTTSSSSDLPIRRTPQTYR